MEILSLLKAFLLALPELIRLVRNIQKMQDEAALAAKVKSDLGKINEAFEKRDPETLKRIFNS